MLVHDVSDVFLETAKIFNYIKDARPWAQVGYYYYYYYYYHCTPHCLVVIQTHSSISLTLKPYDALLSLSTTTTTTTTTTTQNVTDSLFVTFALTFGITRLGIYPFWIIRSCMTDAFRIIGEKGYRTMHVFFAMLFVLQLLHIFW